ncbi:UDP-glycosyltransferase 73C3-like protein [Drosera capensis]
MSHKLHFVLFPMMAQGHMIPIIDMSKLIAEQGVIVTLIMTPSNLSRFQSTIDRAIDKGLDIRVFVLKFPSQKVGLPDGCENFDTLPSLDLSENFMNAIAMLEDPLERRISEMDPRPDCFISDFGFPWTTGLARKFDIPRIIFHGTGCFSLLCSHRLQRAKLLGTLPYDTDSWVVPGIPGSVEITRPWLPKSPTSSSSYMDEIRKKTRVAEEESFGVVVNSFDELEFEYAKGYKEAKGGRVWCLGPVSLCNKDERDVAERGNKAVIDKNQCLEWLDSFEGGSVVYACLGSLHSLPWPHLVELGLGLEASNRPFIWVLRGGTHSAELEKWIEEDGFEERIKGRGLVIRGWAPQVLILSHPAVAVSLTHCGWNSTLEAVTAGIMMVTWPMFLEQFLNQTLVVYVLRIGVKVGVEAPVKWNEEDKGGVMVKKEDVRRALEVVMDEGDEGKAMRRRAKELSEMAKKAIEGGSSEMNLNSFIQEIQDNRRLKSMK